MHIGCALNGGLPGRTHVCDPSREGRRGSPLPQAQQLRQGGLSCVSRSHSRLRRRQPCCGAQRSAWLTRARRVSSCIGDSTLVHGTSLQQSPRRAARCQGPREDAGRSCRRPARGQGVGGSWWLTLTLHAPSPVTAVQMSPHCPATLYSVTSFSSTSGSSA